MAFQYKMLWNILAPGGYGVRRHGEAASGNPTMRTIAPWKTKFGGLKARYGPRDRSMGQPPLDVTRETKAAVIRNCEAGYVTSLARFGRDTAKATTDCSEVPMHWLVSC